MAEFKAVQLLVSNVGSFITYRQIYDCMRGVGFVAGSGQNGFRTNVRSTVRRIRNQFKAQCDDFAEIQTYSSFGYCWAKDQNGDRRERAVALV
jgi:two-component system response regulator ChvI